MLTDKVQVHKALVLVCKAGKVQVHKVQVHTVQVHKVQVLVCTIWVVGLVWEDELALDCTVWVLVCKE